MIGKDVYAIIETLANSQGFYGRLLAYLDELPDEAKNQFLDCFSDCEDAVDIAMAIEG